MTSENEKTEQEKVGVYICHCGGNISDHVDVEKLAEQVKDLPGVSVTHTNTFMCSDPGQALIMDDIKSGKVNRVVVASCAPSLHELTFRGAIKRAGMNPYQYEHANIREQVSWVHHGEGATEKATGLVASAVAKSRLLKPLEPIRVEAKRHAVIVGGGVAGLRASLNIAALGIETVVVEKSPFLGGQAAQLDILSPTNERAEDIIKQLYQEASSHPDITIYTCTEITHSEGYVGNFKLTLRQRPPESPEDMEKLDRYAKKKRQTRRFHSLRRHFSFQYPIQIR